VNKSHFIIDNEQSVMSQILNSKGSAAKKRRSIRDMPLQIKALIGSRQSFTKNNILHSKQDLFVNSTTKNLIQASFLTLVKLQFLQGYTHSNKPIWRDLNEYAMNGIIARRKMTVLCRMVPVENIALGVSSDLFERMNIQNEYFYLSPTYTGINIDSKRTLSLQSARDFGIDYAKSYSKIRTIPLIYTKTIVITQPDSKNGPLSSVDYGVTSQQNVSLPIRPAGQQSRRQAQDPSIGTVEQPVTRPNTGRNRRGNY